MELLKVIILGIVEGITEFLPISSTGHLILVSRLFSLDADFNEVFNIVIQSGAIFAVIIYLKKKVLPPVRSQGEMKGYINLWLKVIVAIMPLGIIGVLFEDKIEEVLHQPLVVALALFGGAVMLLIVESKPKKISIEDEDDISYKDAFLVGVFQCLALIPGMSRSASTIIGGLVIGFKRSVVVEFSFFMAIPVILGASFIKLLKAGMNFTGDEYLLLAVGTLVSFIVAYGVIAFLMNYIKKHDFKVFGYYRMVVGLLVMITFIL